MLEQQPEREGGAGGREGGREGGGERALEEKVCRRSARCPGAQPIHQRRPLQGTQRGHVQPRRCGCMCKREAVLTLLPGALWATASGAPGLSFQPTFPWPQVTGQGCEPVSVRDPPNHSHSQHGAPPTTALSIVRAAGRRGEGTFGLLIAAHPVWRGSTGNGGDWSRDLCGAEQGPGSKREEESEEEGRASPSQPEGPLRSPTPRTQHLPTG